MVACAALVCGALAMRAVRGEVARVIVDDAGDVEVVLPDPQGVAAELENLQQQIDELKAAAARKKAEPKARPKAKDKKPTLTLSGQVQGDQVFFGQDAVSRAAVGDLQDGAQFRRLRIMARGEATEQLEYALGVDFALANQPSFIDNYIEAHDLPWLQNVRFGHFFEPFSLERVTQNRNNTFMERSLVDTFAPARNTGVMAYGTANDDFNTWQIGTFRTNSDNIGNDSFDSGQALTMRGTWLPWWDEETGGASVPGRSPRATRTLSSTTRTSRATISPTSRSASTGISRPTCGRNSTTSGPSSKTAAWATASPTPTACGSTTNFSRPPSRPR